MNKTMKYLSMAALALVGAVVTSCSSDDELLQPANPGKVITLSTTVNLDNGSGTRALTPEGVKTFAVGETMALRYMSASGWKKAVSHALTISDITGGTSATFTFDLEEEPDKTKPVSYVYPASMADEDGDIDFTLLSTQNGTLGTLESNFDLAYETGSWVGENLPSVTLQNQLAILAIKLKKSDDTSFITNTITEMIVSDGTNTYTVTRTAADGPIYVAIKPTLNANITVTATGGSKYYMKTLSNKTYEKNNVYPVNWRMPESVVNGKFTINVGGDKVQFAKGNLRCVNASVSSWSWSFFDTQDGYYTKTEFDDEGKWDLFGWVGKSSRLNNSEPAKWGVNIAKIADDYGTINSEVLASDWGNVPGIGSGWRTLTKAEWYYLFNTRSASTVNGTANARYTKATINTDGTSVNGVILFPDVVTIAADEATTWGTINDRSDWGTQCTTAQWSALEAKGCVFLPAAGVRNDDGVQNVGSNGCYWSSSPYTDNVYYAYNVYFDSGNLNPAYNSKRYYGQSVRLVREVE